MDPLVSHDGDRVLPYLAGGVEEKENEGGGRNLWVATTGQFPLVAGVFWFAITGACAGDNPPHVGTHCDDHQEVLAYFENGGIPAYPLSTVGELCHTTKRGDSGTELDNVDCDGVEAEDVVDYCLYILWVWRKYSLGVNL